MKHPLQALLIAPIRKMREDVLAGSKQITIRDGHRDYRLGGVMLCCPDKPWCVAADITVVRHTTYGEIVEEEYKADGFLSPQEMIEGMRRFYPYADFDKPATVIRWNNVHGKLVDQYHKRQAKKLSKHQKACCGKGPYKG
ncbi:MAG: ASCH domain-containing protein [Candidatus Sungiibacteriota bacterium]|uniref:ASCH domain-containing protein n=1 Tax=Candidatus Sungiibacteriota bacterium TaxID=2750080 RepID=A0A7T5RK15_9BACT|nr:MAG: ASCH domain-containing protein [Candidatus Sungbacteria bacterium]